MSGRCCPPASCRDERVPVAPFPKESRPVPTDCSRGSVFPQEKASAYRGIAYVQYDPCDPHRLLTKDYICNLVGRSGERFSSGMQTHAVSQDLDELLHGTGAHREFWEHEIDVVDDRFVYRL